VEDLKREVDARSDGSNQRIQAAKERAARERQRAREGGADGACEIKQQRKEREEKRGNGKKPKEPRASTTDADARVMKMADGGFRPAYNVQVQVTECGRPTDPSLTPRFARPGPTAA